MLTIDTGAAEPPFEQIIAQITAGRDTGELPAGHRLPSVRALAEELGLAPNTVAKAYRTLEASGVIDTRGRNGSFVTGTAASAERAVRAAAAHYAATVTGLGFAPDAAIAFVRDALDAAGG